jgi:hypothetical protein
LVLEVAENIVQERFPAIENQYCPCDFTEHGPYHRQKHLVAALQPARQCTIPETVVAEAVEQYVSLQQGIKKMQLELDELKETLIGYCQEEGLNRVYGRENAITCKLVEMTGFSPDEVRALLEPEGLWESVLCLDQSRLRELLADATLAKDLRDRLAALRQVVSASPRLWIR